MHGRKTVVGLTDRRWFDYLRSHARDGELDEVNFWRPQAQNRFQSLDVGDPFFFRLKQPDAAIVGHGYFAHWSLLPIRLAWSAFGRANGDATFEGFLARIAEYRRQTPGELLFRGKQLACIILRAVRFYPERQWMRWTANRGWARNIVAYKGYDLSRGHGRALASLLREAHLDDLRGHFHLVIDDQRRHASIERTLREGQGAFRVRVLDAYARRCAATGERSLPALEAAHIQPYRGLASNHVQNGLSLRADIHRLFDAGYVTVTPRHRFEVSARLREDFENGRDYYALHGRSLAVMPSDPGAMPSREALRWHAEHVFR